jgi:hypothetical protein
VPARSPADDARTARARVKSKSARPHTAPTW